jgi:hypothetical protein
MKKVISIILVMLIVNITSSQNPNFPNMHNLVTNKKVTCVKMSGSKVFFGTNDVTDKALYMYDVNTGIKTVIDTSNGVRNMTRVNYMGNEYYVICTDFYGYTIDNTGNKVGTFIMNASGGFYDVVWNVSQQKLYWGCLGKIMYSNWNFSAPTSVINPFFGTNNCIANSLEYNNDTIYIGYYSTTQSLTFVKYYNYSYVTGSDKNGNPYCTDAAILSNKYFITSGNSNFSQGIINNHFASNCEIIGGNSNYTAIENINSTLWIAPVGNKIFKHNGTYGINTLNGTTYNVPTVDTIYDMEIDVNGQMWVASRNGLHTTANSVITNIKDVIKNIDFNVYPNPNNGNFKIYLEQTVDMVIYDITGQEISKQILNIGENFINLENIKTGYYIINLKQKGITIGNKKIIIQ